MTITTQQLKDIIGSSKYDDARFQSIVSALNSTCSRYNINTPLRICHFLSQLLHECGCFQYCEEIWGNTPAQQRYDTRTDLGNTPERDGDGYKYRGRGWIQLTGKNNYRLASAEFNMDLVRNPDLVAKEPLNALVAGWYWHKHDLNTYADKDDIETITKKINGGFNGLEDRKKWLQKSKSALMPATYYSWVPWLNNMPLR